MYENDYSLICTSINCFHVDLHEVLSGDSDVLWPSVCAEHEEAASLDCTGDIRAIHSVREKKAFLDVGAQGWEQNIQNQCQLGSRVKAATWEGKAAVATGRIA